MRAPIALRPALLPDHPVLESLQARASLNNPGDRDALLQHPDAIDVPLGQIAGGHVFVAERDGAIVGFAAVLPREDGAAELDALFVEPALWRTGIGTALIEHGIALAKVRRASVLHVIGNPHAEAFYKSHGFERKGTFKTRFGYATLLERRIPAD